MNRVKSGLVSLLLLVFLVTRTPIAYAQEADGDYEEVTKEEIVPYDGYLFTKEGFANLIANKKKDLDLLKIEYDAKIKTAKIESDGELKKKELELKINKDMYEQLLTLKQNRIESLNTEVNWSNAKLVGGFVIGFISSIVIFYAAVQVVK